MIEFKARAGITTTLEVSMGYKSTAEQLQLTLDQYKSLCLTQRRECDDLERQLSVLQKSSDEREIQMVKVLDTSARLAMDARSMSLHEDEIQAQLVAATWGNSRLDQELACKTTEYSTLVGRSTVLETDAKLMAMQRREIETQLEALTQANSHIEEALAVMTSEHSILVSKTVTHETEKTKLIQELRKRIDENMSLDAELTQVRCHALLQVTPLAPLRYCICLYRWLSSASAFSNFSIAACFLHWSSLFFLHDRTC